MIAVDTNVLVYAHMKGSPLHEPATAWLKRLAEGPAQWAIPWTCIHEFLGIVTNPRIYSPASAPAEAIGQVDEWMRSPSLTLLAETRTHWPTLVDLIQTTGTRAAVIHDARIAATCITHGVTELLTRDRDFARFPGLKVLRLD